MKRYLGLLSCAALLLACGPKVDNSPNVIIETGLGNIEIEVYPDKAPLSAGDFLKHVDRKYYHGQAFYRAVSSENDNREMGMSIIQGGRLEVDPISETVAHESTKETGLRNNAGMVSLARKELGTGSAAFFFINIENNNFLDFGGERHPDGQGFAVFGKVVSGMDVAQRIQQGEKEAPREGDPNATQFLKSPVVITKAYRK